MMNWWIVGGVVAGLLIIAWLFSGLMPDKAWKEAERQETDRPAYQRGGKG